MTTPKDTALSACRQLMEPIIGILLRNGVTHKDLALICKQLYVQVATDEFGIRGRDTNLSRVAMLTGIDRKEVARIKEAMQDNQESEQSQQHQDRLTRLLSAWHQDPEFCTPEQQPKALAIDGEQQSFSQLVRRYGGDFPASALLKELKRVGVVETLADDKVMATKRYFVPDQSDPAALLRAGSVLQDIGNTLHHNIYKANPQKTTARTPAPLRAQQALRFERRASNSRMPLATAAEFQQFVEQEGQAFLERIDAWLSQHEQADLTDATPHWRLGVGTYLFSNLIEPEAPNPGPNPGEASQGDTGDDGEQQ
ncbi:DUF6502 family protein [Cellvibrio fontiphilus]|uniref:DUF6502 family protein n=1 Tax=Cellvibrio fontiphilus TaxID=1815559 RepID=A0ABV7FEQ5_9GAMM